MTPKSSKSKSVKKEVKVSDLPKKEKRVSKDELKKVRGGVVDGADLAVWRTGIAQKVSGKA